LDIRRSSFAASHVVLHPLARLSDSVLAFSSPLLSSTFRLRLSFFSAAPLPPAGGWGQARKGPIEEHISGRVGISEAL
jgi:hypothetical protein